MKAALQVASYVTANTASFTVLFSFRLDVLANLSTTEFFAVAFIALICLPAMEAVDVRSTMS